MSTVSPLAAIGTAEPAILAERLPPETRAHFRRLTAAPAELRALVGFHQSTRLDHIDAAVAADREIARLRSSTPPEALLHKSHE
jgi:hypothetical protein